MLKKLCYSPLLVLTGIDFTTRHVFIFVPDEDTSITWRYGCGSKPMVPFRGRCTTHFRTYFSGWIGMFTGGTDPWPCIFSSLLWVGQHPAPPKTPWNDGSPVNTNQQWFQPWLPSGAEFRPSTVASNSGPVATSGASLFFGVDPEDTAALIVQVGLKSGGWIAVCFWHPKWVLPLVTQFKATQKGAASTSKGLRP